MYTEEFYVEVQSKKYRFFGDFSFNKDAEDCMGTGTLTMPYHPQLWSFWEPGFTEMVIYGGTYDKERIFLGRTRSIAQDGENITINIQDCGWKLKQIYSGTYESKSVKDVFNMLVREAGMTPVILGLTQQYTIKEDEKTSTGAGAGVESGSYSGGSSSYNSTISKKSGSVGIGAAIAKALGKTTTATVGIGNAVTGTVEGIFQWSCKKCPKTYRNANWYRTRVVNRCPGCGGVGTLKYGKSLSKTKGGWLGPCGRVEDNKIEEGHFFCCKCDRDFCGVCGHAHSGGGQVQIVSGPTLVKTTTFSNFATNAGSIAANVFNQLKANSSSSSKVSAANTTEVTSEVKNTTPEQTTTGEEEQEAETPGTYEDELRKLCEGNDLIFFTDQYNKCYLVDYASLMSDIEKNAFKIEKWMIEYPTFKLDVSQFGFANTVVVHYANGSVKESYEDLVAVFGEVKKEFKEPKKNKTQAVKLAKSKLATLLRDFSMEVSADILYSGKIIPGSFVNLINPVTDNKETYYVSGVSVSYDPKSVLKCSLSLLFAPKNPEVSDIPEIAGTPESLGVIAKKYASVPYHGKMPDGGLADCYSMSEHIYHDLIKAGIPARIIQYHSSRAPSGTHRTIEYYSNGNWYDFPYTQYGEYDGFKVGAGKSGGFCVLPNHGTQYPLNGARVCQSGKDKNVTRSGEINY